MSKEELARRFYSKLTVLPSNRVIVSIVVFDILVAGLAVSLVRWSIKPIVAYTLSGLAYILTLLVLLSKPPFNYRRVLGLASYTLSIGLIVELLALPSGIHGLLFTSGTSLAYVAMVGLVTGGATAVTFSITAPMIAYAVLALTLQQPLVDVIANILVAFTGLTVYATYMKLINRRGRHWGFQPLELARAFLVNWLSNIAEPMETILSSLSKPRNARIRILVLNRNSREPIALVLPEIHYGPFRNVGSSMMVYFIEEYMKEKGYNTIVLHGPGSHEHNLPTAKYSRQIALRIAEEFTRAKPQILKPIGFTRLRHGEWEGLVQLYDKLLLLFVTRSKGIDDLPSKLLDLVDSFSSKTGVDVMLVDSHNSYTREEFNGNEVLGLIDKAYSILREQGSYSKLRVGYGESYVDNYQEYGLCNGRVRSIVFSFNGKLMGITYLYGNNMQPQTRLKLRDIVLRQGILDDYEPLTPDDHTCTATLVEHPYIPVRFGEKLGESVLESIRKAIEDLDEAKPEYYQFRIDNVRYVGDGIYDMLGLLGEVGEFVEKTINIVFFSTLIVQLLIVYALSILF